MQDVNNRRNCGEGEGILGTVYFLLNFYVNLKIKPIHFKKETYLNIVNFSRCQSIINKMSNNLPNFFLLCKCTCILGFH